MLNPAFDLERFFVRLKGAGRRALLLDYDGTIAPFHVDPRQARPYPEVCEILGRIVAIANSRVAIVSGRRLEDLAAPLSLVPHTEVWASHGWEWIVDGRTGRRVPPGDVRLELARAAAVAEDLKAWGARIERKIASVAVHWRGLPPATAKYIDSALRDAWLPLTQNDLAILPFDGGVELRARAHHKGDAVRAMLVQGQDTVCAYLGDDTTDEDAFRAIRPHGLGVLVREQPRNTHAELWISNREELAAFLTRWEHA